MKKHPQVEKTDWAAVGSRVLIGLLFIISGYSKAAYPAEVFAAALEGYRVFPDALLMPIAQTVPWVELLAGAYLLTGFNIKRVSLVLLGMLGVFEAVLLSVIARNIDLASCGCYGAYGPHLSPVQAVTSDAALILFVIYIFANPRQPFSLDGWIEKGT